MKWKKHNDRGNLENRIVVDSRAIIAFPSFIECRPLLTAAKIIFSIFFFALIKVDFDKSNIITSYLMSQKGGKNKTLE